MKHQVTAVATAVVLSVVPQIFNSGAVASEDRYRFDQVVKNIDENNKENRWYNATFFTLGDASLGLYQRPELQRRGLAMRFPPMLDSVDPATLATRCPSVALPESNSLPASDDLVTNGAVLRIRDYKQEIEDGEAVIGRTNYDILSDEEKENVKFGLPANYDVHRFDPQDQDSVFEIRIDVRLDCALQFNDMQKDRNRGMNIVQKGQFNDAQWKLQIDTSYINGPQELGCRFARERDRFAGDHDRIVAFPTMVVSGDNAEVDLFDGTWRTITCTKDGDAVTLRVGGKEVTEVAYGLGSISNKADVNIGGLITKLQPGHPLYDDSIEGSEDEDCSVDESKSNCIINDQFHGDIDNLVIRKY